jgi:choline dehydrogenase
MPRPLLGTDLQFKFQNTVRNAVADGSSLPTNIDFRAGNTNGAGLFQYAIRPASTDTSLNNKRWWAGKQELPAEFILKRLSSNAAEAYVYPFLSDCSNLTILTDHLATRMTFSSGSQRKAQTVEFIPTAGGTTQSVKVRREVVVAGGAIASAAFLELSGVGDPRWARSGPRLATVLAHHIASVLNAAGVPVVLDLPSVGANLQDQFFVNFEWTPKPNTPFIPPAPNALQFVSTSFLTLKQVVGSSTAAGMISALNASIPARAASTVANGGFTSVAGMKDLLALQVKLMTTKKGAFTTWRRWNRLTRFM